VPDTPLKRIPPEQLPPELRPVWDLANSRSGDATAIEAWANHLPMLDWYFNGFYRNVFYNGDPRMVVDVRTKELLRIKLSKQHGCRFCNRWNSVDCLAAGITQAQIDHVLAPTPEHFDEKDLAVIELADQMMLQNMAGQLDQGLYARLRKYYSDAQIVEMGFVAAVLTGMAKYIFVFDLVEREETCPVRPPEATPG
jgi:alkylhydroperoxidase family enzyme